MVIEGEGGVAGYVGYVEGVGLGAFVGREPAQGLEIWSVAGGLGGGNVLHGVEILCFVSMMLDFI